MSGIVFFVFRALLILSSRRPKEDGCVTLPWRPPPLARRRGWRRNVRRKAPRSRTRGRVLEVAQEVVRLLLLVSGDVESNPGPGDPQSE